MNEDYLSPNHDDRNGVEPSLLVLHYTGMQTAREALLRLSDPESKVSAHYTVDEDGVIYRHVDEGRRAWHAGHAFWRGETDINAHSIGIEIVNPGHEWGYRAFTEAQIEALIPLCGQIMKRYHIEAEDVLAHADVAPARKEDPGEFFPWKDLARAGIGVWPDVSEEDRMKAATMRIEQALHDWGYDPRVKLRDKITAFQRHFVPEAFAGGRRGGQEEVGQAGSLTQARLYALLAGHFLDVS